MRQLRDILTRSKRPGSYVLGTVVDVEGSSYRKPGARVLIGEDGSRVGLISGGCLEKDVVRHAFTWTDDGPQVVLYDTRGDKLKPQGDYGAGCDGLVYLLLERWPAGPIDPLAEIERVWETGESAVLATVVEGEEVGARGILRGGELQWSDGVSVAVREVLAPRMEDALEWKRPRTVKLEGGSVLLEPLRPPPDLVVFGAGDDARLLVNLAQTMGWTVHVADKWPALVTRERFPGASSLTCKPVERLPDELSLREGSFVVLMTHSLGDDAVLLPAMLRSGASFIGLLGPRRRTARLMTILAERGELPAAEELDRLQTPVGLDLGGDSPAQVALSIVASIAAHRNGRSGGLLRESEGPIHPPHERIDEGSG